MNINDEELLDFKRNIIDWYPFKENSKILEIWEGQESIQNENLDENFDYIFIIGLGEKDFEEILDSAITKLKSNGTLLIAVDNEIGINSLCTENNSSSKKVSRKKIESILKNIGFSNQKFYYALPNYKYTNVIFTDEFLPNIETISRCITLYDENTIVALDERKRFKQLINEDRDLFKKFANSFIIECSKNYLEENNIKFVSYNNARKQKYRVKTIIQGENVYKYPATQEAKQHIENIKRNIEILKSNNIKTIDSYDETRIISKFEDNNLLVNNILINSAREGKKEEVFNLITKFEEELINKFKTVDIKENCFDKYNISYKEEDIKNLHFIKDGLWDMFFQNCFYIDSEFYFYDQEWLEENIPIEFIMYRAIRYIGNELFETIQKDDLYQRLNLQKEQLDIFEQLDDILQENIRNDIVWEIHKDNKEANRLLIKIDQLQNQIIEQDSKEQELIRQINEAEKTIKIQRDELNGIKNSKTWKLTEPLREAKRALKGKDKK